MLQISQRIFKNFSLCLYVFNIFKNMFKIRRKNRSGIYVYMEYDVLNTVAQNMPNIIHLTLNYYHLSSDKFL